MSAIEEQVKNDDDAELEDVIKKAVCIEAGTIGNGHYLVLKNRCDEIAARIDDLAVLIAAQDAERHQIELQIDELRERFELGEQQCQRMISATQARQETLETRLGRIDRRIYSMQDTICKKTTTMFPQPVQDSSCWEVSSDVSQESSSTSFETRTNATQSGTEENNITEEMDEYGVSPVRNRAFYRSQGLDIDADPFEMPIPAPDAASQHFMQSDYQSGNSRITNPARNHPSTYKRGRQIRNRSLLNPSRHQLNKRQPYRRSGPPPGLEPYPATVPEAHEMKMDPSGDSCIDYVKAMCKQYDVPNLKQDDQQKRPPPRPLQPMSAKAKQHRLPPATK